MPPLSRQKAKDLVRKRRPEWAEFQQTWRFLADSLEGGERYRHADYTADPFSPVPKPWYANPTGFGGFDSPTGEAIPFGYGTIVKRNLVPHNSEMSPDGSDLYAQRLHRTPVPMLVEWVTRRYLSRVYARQIRREFPKSLDPWQENVDGKGTDLQCWMRKTVAPLLLAVGHLDLIFGHPAAPDGTAVRTRADSAALGLDRCVSGFILPENMVWWKLNDDDSYAECLVCERRDGEVTDATPATVATLTNHHWRHWTAEDCSVYDSDGDLVLSYPHPFRRVPIVRVFDHKKTRCRNVGQSRMETIADLQKSVYNRKSELVLSDVLQCHAILQGPEEFIQANGRIATGPGRVMPKKAGRDGNTYEGWEYVDHSDSGATECRTHIQDELDEAVLYASLLKPAGTTFGSTVSQSGISKAYDYTEQNDILCEIAETLGEAEEVAARMALVVLTDGSASDADLDALEVEYPSEFGLFDGNQVAGALDAVQAAVSRAGGLPEAETELLCRLLTVSLSGLDEDRLAEITDEVRTRVAAQAVTKAQATATAATAMAAGAAAAPAAAAAEKPGQAAKYPSPILAQSEGLMAIGAGPGEI